MNKTIASYDISDINNKYKLSFLMSNEEISLYYKLINSFVDTENKLINYGIVDLKTKEKLIAERSENSDFFEYRIIFVYEGMSYGFSRTMVRPDGYINYNNYIYRSFYNSHFGTKNFIQYAEEGVNPLQTYPGFIITEKDIPVYERIFAGEIPNIEFVGWKEIAPLKSGTVIRVMNVSTNDCFPLMGTPNGKGYIKATDIELITILRESVSYKLIDDKLYRFINEQKIEIMYHSSGYHKDGYRYIRNDPIYNIPLNRFYFWEKTGDYLFDEEGNLIEIVDFGPDYTGK